MKYKTYNNAKSVFTDRNLLEINSNPTKNIAIRITSLDLPPDVKFVIEFDYKKAFELAEKIKLVAKPSNRNSSKKVLSIDNWLNELLKN